MDLWIRSQDKNVLENVKGFCITHSSETCWNILNVDTTTRYGTYKTKARALEVLDEIQSLIDFMINREMNRYDAEEYMQICYEELEKIKENGLIYQMPKE